MSRIRRSLLLAGVAAMFSGILTASASAQSAAPGAATVHAKQKVRAAARHRARVVRTQPVQTPPVERCDNLLCKFFVILGVGY